MNVSVMAWLSMYVSDAEEFGSTVASWRSSLPAALAIAMMMTMMTIGVLRGGNEVGSSLLATSSTDTEAEDACQRDAAPLLEQEGWTRPKEKCREASFERSGRGGQSRTIVCERPPRRFAPPLLYQEGSLAPNGFRNLGHTGEINRAIRNNRFAALVGRLHCLHPHDACDRSWYLPPEGS